MGKDAGTIKREIEQTRERMNDTVEALGYKADVGSRVREGVADQVETVKGTIGDMVENVKSAVVGASQTVGDAASGTAQRGAASVSGINAKMRDAVPNIDVREGTGRAVGVVRENPIGLAIAALALGYLAGSIVPVSDVERRRLKPIRDKVVDQAQAATHDLIEAGKSVVAETAQSVVATAMSSAQTHGRDVVDAAKTRAEMN